MYLRSHLYLSYPFTQSAAILDMQLRKASLFIQDATRRQTWHTAYTLGEMFLWRRRMFYSYFHYSKYRKPIGHHWIFLENLNRINFFRGMNEN